MVLSALLRRSITIACVCITICSDASAIVTFGTQDNSIPPTDPAMRSVWDRVARVSGFTATPIAPDTFVIAKHIGAGVNSTITDSAGVSHRVIQAIDAPESLDIRVLKTATPTARFASIFDQSLIDIGQYPGFVVGRGTRRGAEVRVNNEPAGALRGWEWGASDSVMRWAAPQRVSIYPTSPGDAAINFAFDATSPYSGQATGGDSSGPMFVMQGGQYKLAGVISTLGGIGNVSYTAAGPEFRASIFAAGGLYQSGQLIQPTSLLSSSTIGTSTLAAGGWLQQFVPHPGDSNLDGNTDIADLVSLAQNWNRPNATWAQGDFNQDDQVTLADLLVLVQEINANTHNAPIPFPVEIARLIPEPTSAAAGLALVGVSLRRRRLSGR